MKYLKFTYVDSITGVPVTESPAENGPKYPDVAGLEFVWARESQYPTPVPEFFGTCPDESDTNVPGVLGVIEESDWLQMQRDELRARIPASITMRQARLALLNAGLLDDVDAALAAIPDSALRRAAQIEWEYAATVDRSSPWVSNLASALNLSESQLDHLFVEAAKL